MKDDNLKALILDRIDRTAHRIEVIKCMLEYIQDRDYHLHFCYKDEAAFAGEAEQIEHDLLYDVEKDCINKLKQRLQKEQESLDSYDRLLTGKNKNKK